MPSGSSPQGAFPPLPSVPAGTDQLEDVSTALI